MPGENYLVVGGCGFLGRHIVEQLLARGESSVSVFDIVQRHFDSNVTFFTGDISKLEDVENAISKCSATSVIHTASPNYHASDPILLEMVNVTGTQNVVDACVNKGVRKLVYTASGAVLLDGVHQLITADERLDYPEVHLDKYNETKMKAEQIVLAANDSTSEKGLLTCSIRPAGIFGPGDSHNIRAWHNVVVNGQTKWQIGDNLNLNDFTYVGNVAYAHLLASDKLADRYPCVNFSDPLQSTDISLGHHRIPTSEARPIGPNTSPSEADLLCAKRFESGEINPSDLRPVLRNRMDQFSDAVNDDNESATYPIAGQAYFITNGEPTYAWDFNRGIWSQFGPLPSRVWALPLALGYVIGYIAEFISQYTGKEAGLTPYRIKQVTQNRYFDTEKARRLLGYEPQVGIVEGIKLTTDWYKGELAKRGETESKKTQ